ncbi:MAG TPA: hypothetical protein VH559_05040 [Gemmatimonadaceae bacterium]
MIHRIVTALAVVAGIIGIACVDMSAPAGAASITPLLLPSPSVVVGDTMRDSNGVVAPITVTAFDGAGNPIQAIVQLFITDTLGFSHLGTDNVLVGDSIGETRMLGQVGTLQTLVATIPVTYAPTQVVPDSIKAIQAPFGPDSASTIGFAPVSVRVLASNDSASQGMIVRFVILQAPPTRSGVRSPAVYLANTESKLPSAVDTTDSRGFASRNLVVISNFFTDSLQGGAKADSAIVVVTAKYKGVELPGSGVHLTVPISVSTPSFSVSNSRKSPTP